jgi:hypothetical protein
LCGGPIRRSYTSWGLRDFAPPRFDNASGTRAKAAAFRKSTKHFGYTGGKHGNSAA